jgi:pimeloyl-ACP methyl ester carboxylesterase
VGQKLAGAAFGEQGAPALVLVHGFPLDGRMWEAQVGPLSAHCRVLVPDLRGFGRSPLPKGDHGIEEHARDLAEFMDAHSVSRAILCGFSMGGYVTLSFSALFPWRLTGMVLADSRAGADAGQAKEARTRSAWRVRNEGLTFLADEMLFKLLSPQAISSDVELCRKVWSIMVDQRPEGVAAALIAMRDRVSMLDQLQHVRCPALALAGTADTLTPPLEVRAMAERIPGCRYAEVPGAGHLACMEKPHHVNKLLLEFVAGISF